jgi:hypothetical protein
VGTSGSTKAREWRKYRHAPAVSELQVCKLVLTQTSRSNEVRAIATAKK